MGRRWVTSNGTTAVEVTVAKVAVGGVVKRITKACVADGGVVRQFWPYDAGFVDPRILFTSDPITVTHTVADPEDAFATITFNRDLGIYTYNDSPNADITEQYLAPVVSGAGQYLIKVDQVSGTALTGTLGSWIDIYSAAVHVWLLAVTSLGSATALANISIAEDDGGGSPVAATVVTKAVTFNAEVTGSSYVIWPTNQRDLVEIKDSVDADCDLIFNTDGTASGSADTSGSFTENWHSAAPAAPSPGDFTVRFTLISGTAPTGATLGADLTLDQVRQVTLLATTGENLSCALDVKVSDGVISSTKRVTMNSQRTIPVDPPAWTTTQWESTDAGYIQGAGLDVSVYITFNIDGTATLSMDSFTMPLTVFETDDWFDTPPPLAGDLDFYEIKVDPNGAGQKSGTFDTWLRMTENRSFTLGYVTFLNATRVYTFTASVRTVGGLAIDKTVQVTVIQSDGSTP